MNENLAQVAVELRVLLSVPQANAVAKSESDISEKSGSIINVEDATPLTAEQIVTLSGTSEQVAQAIRLILVLLNNIKDDETDSIPLTLDLVVAQVYLARTLFGFRSTQEQIANPSPQVRELEAASGTKISQSISNLPLSSERVCTIVGVLDGIQIAVYQLSLQLATITQHATATTSQQKRQHRDESIAVVAPFKPLSVVGTFANPTQFNGSKVSSTDGPNALLTSPSNPYGLAADQVATVGVAGIFGDQVASKAAAPLPDSTTTVQSAIQVPTTTAAAAATGANVVSQQIYIPNEMVGAIIGKGGQKISEIRQMSGSIIKITDPTTEQGEAEAAVPVGNERMITVTGTPESNQKALYMLYSRIESEKQRQL